MGSDDQEEPWCNGFYRLASSSSKILKQVMKVRYMLLLAIAHTCALCLVPILVDFSKLGLYSFSHFWFGWIACWYNFQYLTFIKGPLSIPWWVSEYVTFFYSTAGLITDLIHIAWSRTDSFFESPWLWIPHLVPMQIICY